MLSLLLESCIRAKTSSTNLCIVQSDSRERASKLQEAADEINRQLQAARGQGTTQALALQKYEGQVQASNAENEELSRELGAVKGALSQAKSTDVKMKVLISHFMPFSTLVCRLNFGRFRYSKNLSRGNFCKRENALERTLIRQPTPCYVHCLTRKMRQEGHCSGNHVFPLKDFDVQPG